MSRWWFFTNPIWKLCASQNGWNSSPIFGVNNYKIFELPHSGCTSSSCLSLGGATKTSPRKVRLGWNLPHLRLGVFPGMPPPPKNVGAQHILSWTTIVHIVPLWQGSLKKPTQTNALFFLGGNPWKFASSLREWLPKLIYRDHSTTYPNNAPVQGKSFKITIRCIASSLISPN